MRVILGMAGLVAAVAVQAAPRSDGLVAEVLHEGNSNRHVLVTAQLSNRTAVALPLGSRPHWHARCGFSLTISGPKGRRTLEGDSAACEEIKDTLAPGSSVAVSHSLERAEWFPTPGNYTLVLSWVEPGQAPVQSEPLQLRITGQ